MKKTENLSPQVLIIGSGNMCEDDCRIHENWITKYNIFNKVHFDSAIKKGQKCDLIVFKAVDHCGTRTVYECHINNKFVSMPLNIFNDLGIYIWNNYFRPDTQDTLIHLFLSQTDPGLGIILPQDNKDNYFSYRQVNPIKRIYELQRRKEENVKLNNNDLFGEDIVGYSI